MPTIEKLLGKIVAIHYGLGGYQDSQLGLSIILKGNDWVPILLLEFGIILIFHLQLNFINGLKKIELIN